MIPRAEWHPRREDRRARWRPRLERGSVATLVLLLSALSYGLALNFPFVVFGALVALVGFGPSSPRRSSRASKALEESAPWPLPPRTFPVRIEYDHDIDRIASDEGLASFGEGWMTVEGLRLSFALRTQDVQALRGADDGCDLYLAGGRRIAVRPYDTLRVGAESATTLRKRFSIELDRWLDGERAEGEPLLPSTVLLSLAPRERTATLAIVGASAAFCGFVAIANTMAHRALPPGWALLLGFGLGLLAAAALRVRRHVEYVRALPPRLRGATSDVPRRLDP